MTSFDVHQHLWPEQFVAELARRTAPPYLADEELVLDEGRYPMPREVNDLSRRLELLDRDEIDVAVISLQPTLWTDALPLPERDALERAWVEGARELMATAGDRLLAFSPGRLEDGFVGASVGATALADLDGIASLLDELERRSAPLFVHPGPAPFPPGAPEWWPAIVDYPTQMHAAYFHWLASGRERWPTVRVVFAILAGGAPFQLERLAQRGRDVRSTLDPNVYLDVASYGRRSIGLCAQTFGAENLVYGSDRPVVDPAPTLKAVRGFGESMEKLITVDNPTALLR